MTSGAGAGDLARVAVVIVSFNVRDLLRGCLQSILAQSDRGTDVVVVDNASSDGSTEMVSREFPQVRLIKNSRNGGFSSASNQGIAATHALYVLSLNPDTE